MIKKLTGKLIIYLRDWLGITSPSTIESEWAEKQMRGYKKGLEGKD